ncbi:MAG: STAS domain-containing protein [Spirochaetes bacterium]|nr:STAS domain-containing protein [Spirochaetota bacterium]
MNLKTSDHGNVKIVHLEGKLDVNLSIEIESEFEKMIDAGVTRMVLDLKQVEYLSSSGLRIFISAMRKLKEKKGRLVLCNVTPMVKKIFKIVELEDIFEIHDNYDKAVEACGK